MMKRALPFSLGAVLALTLVNTHAGGWAVVTIEDLPERFVAGQATTLKYSVRQHGQRLVGGLTGGGVSARSGARLIEAAATPKEPGYYTVSLTLPEPGDWTLTVHSGFGASNITLLPIRAAAPSETPAAATAAVRGEQLFVAKGCNSCHFHGAINGRPIAPIGADLTDKRYSDPLLSKLLTDPSVLPAAGTFGMPNLNLRSNEVAALVAFINKSGPRAVTAR